MVAQPSPQPPPTTKWSDTNNAPALPWRQYLLSIDMVIRALANNFFGAPVQLTNAANDGAAAAAGVQIGQLYRNGSVVQIRVT